MPQSKVERLIERSVRPRSTNATISLRYFSGVTKSGLIAVKLEEPVLIGRKLEEIALLLDPFDRRAGRREAAAAGSFGQLGFVEKMLRRGPNTSPDIWTDRCRPPPPFWSRARARPQVAGLRGAHDVVGCGEKSGAHRGELRRGAVGELLRGEAFARGSPLHLLAMFVHAGDEQDIDSRRAA